MNITKEVSESKGKLIAENGDIEMGEMTFSIANDGQLWIVDHTGVNEAFEGTGVGKALYDELVKLARGAEIKVMPLCPFTRKMFERNKDDWDVLRHNSL